MDKIKICEAMYALPGEVVVRRRKSLVLPAALLAAGVAILVLIVGYFSPLPPKTGDEK